MVTEYVEKTRLPTCLFQGTSDGRPPTFPPRLISSFFLVPHFCRQLCFLLCPACACAVEVWLARFVDAGGMGLCIDGGVRWIGSSIFFYFFKGLVTSLNSYLFNSSAIRTRSRQLADSFALTRMGTSGRHVGVQLIVRSPGSVRISRWEISWQLQLMDSELSVHVDSGYHSLFAKVRRPRGDLRN